MATARPGSSAAASDSAAAAGSASAAETGTPEAAAIPNTRKYISRCCDSSTRSRCVPSATLLFCVFSRVGPPPRRRGSRADFLRFFFSVMSFPKQNLLPPRPRAHLMCQSSSTRSCSPRRPRTSRRPRLPSSRPLPSSLPSSSLASLLCLASHPLVSLLLRSSSPRPDFDGRPPRCRWSRTSSLGFARRK